jgi:hypothetical protein
MDLSLSLFLSLSHGGDIQYFMIMGRKKFTLRCANEESTYLGSSAVSSVHI